jgi:hydroxymethylglutaryl-CoA synthase
MYIGLTSLLENSEEDLAGKNIALFSYGSGCVAEFFSGKVVDGYQQWLFKDLHKAMLDKRQEVSYEDYLTLYNAPDPKDGAEHTIPAATSGRFRLAAISHHKREYVAI